MPDENNDANAQSAGDKETIDGPTGALKPWRYALRRAVHEFNRNQCADTAAALTYHSVLSIFPATIALLSLIGLIGQRGKSVDAITRILEDAGATSLAANIEPTLRALSTAAGAGFALTFGFLGALWAASGYLDAFGRAMNGIYGTAEGRPVWKRRPFMVLVAFILLLLTTAVLGALIITGPIAGALGSAIGASSAAVLTWQIVKWPVILLIILVIVSILYHATPNVKLSKFRWLSRGGLIAIGVWVVASIGFGFYVANFSSYNKTYGALAGVIIFLIWLWISNLALLFGGALDAETERIRQLRSGTAAEDELQLKVRNTHDIIKKAQQYQADVARGRELRRAINAAQRDSQSSNTPGGNQRH